MIASSSSVALSASRRRIASAIVSGRFLVTRNTERVPKRADQLII